MPENTLDENLFLSAIVLKLASVPINEKNADSVLLHNFLTDIADPSPELSLLSVLRQIAAELDKAKEKVPKLSESAKRKKRALMQLNINQRRGDLRAKRVVDVLRGLRTSSGRRWW